MRSLQVRAHKHIHRISPSNLHAHSHAHARPKVHIQKQNNDEISMAEMVNTSNDMSTSMHACIDDDGYISSDVNSIDDDNNNDNNSNANTVIKTPSQSNDNMHSFVYLSDHMRILTSIDTDIHNNTEADTFTDTDTCDNANMEESFNSQTTHDSISRGSSFDHTPRGKHEYLVRNKL